MKKMRLFGFVFLLLLAACQTPPTKTKETSANQPTSLSGEIVVDANTVLLDARPLFLFTNSHLATAYPVQWKDYSRPGATDPGPLDPDSFSIARRMARWGITPTSQVVVLGLGKEGQGEEGRVAWMLAYLGVKNVRFAREDFLQGKRVSGEPLAPKNAAIWKPVLQRELLTTEAELRSALNHNRIHPKDKIWIIDVRPSAEYLRRTGEPDLGAINIEWREFINSQGRPRQEILAQLESLGLSKDKNIIVVGPQGVASALVTMALREMGYQKVSNHIPNARAR